MSLACPGISTNQFVLGFLRRSARHRFAKTRLRVPLVRCCCVEGSWVLEAPELARCDAQVERLGGACHRNAG